ncbi:DUF308 domain-containing protein [Hymenobacter sp. BT683]|uniref:DUF308 domain-containing protein n=1 Tax=Hymenobacter jeongseonensis TaxID=2791027 RepID=A0ABS0IBR5_9BACT|nr:DUF308 domain-containing protein [Hymenobacter jeongseonensis]MBF9235796.1 DUF308 domain-containing protein [Hymenobacter jeongseonensis]
MIIPSVLQLQTNWWLLALRGLVATTFGLLTFLNPRLTLLVLVVLFGGFCIVNGILAMVVAFRRGRGRPRWWWLVLEGSFSVLVGMFTLVWPRMTLMGLLFAVAVWAIVTGGLQIGTAIRLRKEITGEWILLLSGLLSILFGGVVLAWPGVGALAIAWWMGAYIFFVGILMSVLAFRLRRHPVRSTDASSSSVASAAG